METGFGGEHAGTLDLHGLIEEEGEDATPDRLGAGVDEMVPDSGGKENGHAGFEFHGAAIVALRALAGEDVENLFAVRMVVLGVARPRNAEPVKLRSFPGFTIEETTDVPGVSTPTVQRAWTYSRAWLYRQIMRTDGAAASISRAS